MRYPKCDLHTHTCFCDGANTPEAMVQEAIARGMETIGLSGHSYVSFDPGWCMSPEEILEYRAEIARLKSVYGDRIRILCGIEQDICSQIVSSDYDYIIGSVHCLFENGVYLSVDGTLETVQKNVREQFGGDIYRYLRLYFDTVSQLAEKTDCDIVGHIDLVEKFNQGERLFSRDDYRYKRALIDAIDVLLEKDLIFEINTGAMSRGYRDLPYPSCYALRRIAEKRGRVALNSDAHRKENLMYWFEHAVQYAASCGVGGLTVPTEKGWVTRPLGSF